MIARFRYLLSVHIPIDPCALLAPQEVRQDPYDVLIHPPYRAVGFNPTVQAHSFGVDDVSSALEPETPPSVSDTLKVNDRPLVLANALQVSLSGPEFARSTQTDSPATVAALTLAERMASSIITRLRAITGASWLRDLSDILAASSIEVLNDDGILVASNPVLWRRRYFMQGQVRLFGLTSVGWAALTNLPSEYEAPRWDTLLLDAELNSGQAGTALVLAASAVETAVDDVISFSVPKGPEAPFWRWVLDRGAFHKDPSLAERCDVILAALCGKSLKSETKLWQAFMELKEARNTYIHEGRLELGGRALTASDAQRLLIGARDIVSWFEQLLPSHARRMRVTGPQATLTGLMNFARGAA